MACLRIIQALVKSENGPQPPYGDVILLYVCLRDKLCIATERLMDRYNPRGGLRYVHHCCIPRTLLALIECPV